MLRLTKPNNLDRPAPADETGVLTLLKNSENDLTRIREHFPAAGEYAARLHSVLEELKDIDNAVAADSERLDADPERLARTRRTPRRPLRPATKAPRRLRSGADRSPRPLCRTARRHYAHGDEETRSRLANQELDAARTRRPARWPTGCTRHARAGRPGLRQADTWRRSCSWACPKHVFRVALTPLPDLRCADGGRPTAVSHSASRPTATRRPQSVERIASGGELSRVMLALKALLARRMQLPTGHLRRDRHGRLRAHRRRHGRDHLRAGRNDAGRRHHPPAAGGVERVAAHFVVYKRDGRTRTSPA